MSSPRNRAENLLLVAISVILGLLLWIQVSEEQQVQKAKEFTLALRYEGLRPGLILVDQTEFVKVVITGPARLVDTIDSEALQPMVNLRSSGPGTYSLPIRVPPVDGEMTASLSRAEATFTLEEVKTVTLEVEVETLGQSSPDFRYEGASVQPERITLSGPSSQVRRAQRARVMLDLASIRPGVAIQLPVEPLDRNNQPLPLVVSDPVRVDVFPAVAAAENTVTLLVVPQWNGSPAFGYAVSGYELKPNTVQVRGSASAVANLQTILTEPIPIAGLKSVAGGSIKLAVPPGVEVVGASAVTYEVRAVATPVGPNR